MGERCITFGVPRLTAAYSSVFEVVQSPNEVVFVMETIHNARVIPLDGAPHLSPAITQWDGNSRGHWEGDTLVVDTVGFNAKSDMMGASTGLHLDRALHAHRTGRVAVRRDDGRSVDVDGALDRAHPDEADRRAADRVRVPRRQSRDGRHSRGCPQAGSGRRAREEIADAGGKHESHHAHRSSFTWSRCRRVAALAAPPAEIVIPGERLLTESITSARDGTVYIGSVGTGQIFRAQPGAATAQPFIAPKTNGIGAVFGVFADEKANLLWACSGALPGPPQVGRAAPPPPSALYSFDLKSGAPKGKWNMPTAGAFCNDIAVGADGTAYASDTQNMQVARLRARRAEPRSLGGRRRRVRPDRRRARRHRSARRHVARERAQHEQDFQRGRSAPTARRARSTR